MSKTLSFKNLLTGDTSAIDKSAAVYRRACDARADMSAQIRDGKLWTTSIHGFDGWEPATSCRASISYLAGEYEVYMSVNGALVPGDLVLA